jgi:hypothetical protein
VRLSGALAGLLSRVGEIVGVAVTSSVGVMVWLGTSVSVGIGEGVIAWVGTRVSVGVGAGGSGCGVAVARGVGSGGAARLKDEGSRKENTRRR